MEGDSIFNGAFDNASGSSILLEVARAFTELESGPKRSLLFLVVTGEEKGLLGSDYFAHHPTVPMSSIVANVNLDMVGPMAAALPHVPLVLQESWSLSADQQAEIDRLVRTHSNVTFRAFEPRPGMIFRDAGVLLAPHRLDNRPRTVLEAQANGVPVIASDHPGLQEAVGDGGALVDREAGPDAWVRALGDLWDDPDRRMTLGDRARMHAARPEIRPETVAARFMEIVGDLLDERIPVEVGS